MTKKAKITFAITESLKKDLLKSVISDGYGLRGKSKWISEAVIDLIKIKDFEDLIAYNDGMHGFNKMETAIVDPAIEKIVEESVVVVRKKHPALEGVKSRIMRTAIIQRIVRT